MNLAKLQIQNQNTGITYISITNNEKSEREIEEWIPFTTTTERIKYLGINLPKEAKELYTEKYKTLREGKSKGEKERYSHLNAEFQRIARRDKKAFFNDQCKNRGKQQNGKD